MKKLLKSGICGSMNSARMHCSRLTWSNSAAGKKKRKKFRKRRCSYNSNPNGHIVGTQSDELQRISDLRLSFMVMQYPILFPFGEDGFYIGIPYLYIK